nr:reverse transcriptase domain-containing protein [Tanacetum cinerariifolium]
MTLEEIKKKFIPVWKQLKDFVPMSSKEEGKRIKRKGIKLDQGSAKKIKTYEDVSEEVLKGMMQLVPLEEVYVEALQLWTLVKETLSIKHATKDKEKELWVELKRLFEPDFEDQLWTHNQAFIHDPLEWKLYDTCGVHHVFTKDQKIFMLVEKDYPLRNGLATVMICNKLQVEQYLQMANDLILKIHNIANTENMLVKVGKFTFPIDFIILEMEEDSKVPLILGRPFLHTADTVIRVKQKRLNLGTRNERMIFNIDSTMKHSHLNNDTYFSIDVIDEILEEDFEALFDEGSKILHFIKRTYLKKEILTEFNEFIAMTLDENSNSESDTEEPPFEEITINTDFKIETSLEEPPDGS